MPTQLTRKDVYMQPIILAYFPRIYQCEKIFQLLERIVFFTNMHRFEKNQIDAECFHEHDVKK